MLNLSFLDPSAAEKRGKASLDEKNRHEYCRQYCAVLCENLPEGNKMLMLLYYLIIESFISK